MANERFARAAKAAACQTLADLGPNLVGLGVWTMWAPKIGLGALSLGAASNLAYEYSCSEFDAGVSPPDDGVRGCAELSAGYGDLAAYGSDGTFKAYIKKDITGYTASAETYSPTSGGNTRELTFQTTIGGAYGGAINIGLAPGDYLQMILQGGAACGKEVVPLPLVPPEVAPYKYTDPESNCELTLNFQGFVQRDEGGKVEPVYQISSGDDVLRADGGRIGGCIIKPTIYTPGGGGGGDGGGGGIDFPIPEDIPLIPGPNGEPWWADILDGIIGGASALIAEKLFDALVEESYDGLIYRAVSVCEKDAEGEPISEAVEVPIPALQAPSAQIARLDAIVELLQAHKNFKQPTCDKERPTLEGDWRTISFRSQESSPYGKSCLRKRFRYRSLSGIGLGQLVDHWKDFTWQSGPVIVSHKGYSWGTPQVWAATADEGKRVIQHAAREAGFDADQVGKWGISNSSSSRYGVSLPMKVDTTGGYYWITDRDGSNARPIVALTPHP